MDRIRTAVKFQHRVPTGHAKLKPSTAGQATRHHTPVPTELRIEDALVILAPRAPEGEEPRLTLLYANGVAMVGADWQSAVSVEHDVPHQDHPGAEDSERFWFVEEETTEGRDRELQALADEMAMKSSGPALVTETKLYSDGSSATGPAPLPDQSPAQQFVDEEESEPTPPATTE